MPPIIINADGDVRQVASIGTGDVTGPGTSTDNAIARFDGTTGKVIQDSGVLVPDALSGNVVSDTGTQTLSNKTLTTPTISSAGFTNANHNHVGVSAGGNVGGTTTKGDLIGVDGSNTHARLAVGTDEQVIKADSAAGVGLSYAWRVYQIYENGVSVVDPAKQIDFKDFNVVDGGGNVAYLYHDIPFICDGRLTLTSGTGVTTSDVSGGSAATLYFTPFNGAKISLYDETNSRWVIYGFSELSASLSGLTTSQPYDVFVYNNSSTLTLYLLAWSSNTARATALTKQDGVWVLSGAGNLKYKYVGTVKMQATGQSEDSVLRRFVWNNYNRRSRKLLVTDSTNSWSDTNNSTWHALNSSTANRVELVIGLSEDVVDFHHWFYASSVTCYVGICLDNTNANDCDIKLFQVVGGPPVEAVFCKPIAIGYHFLQLTNLLSIAGTATIVGDNNAPTLQQFGGVGFCMA